MTSPKPEHGRSLADLFPEIASQAVGWNPSEVKAGSHRKVRWSCDLGHEWDAEVKSRVEGRGCPVCAGKKVLTGFNDLATTHPELASQAHGWECL